MTSHDLIPGGTVQLEADPGATFALLTGRKSVSIAPGGLVTGLAPGSAIVEIRSAQGAYLGREMVKVADGAPPAPPAPVAPVAPEVVPVVAKPEVIPEVIAPEAPVAEPVAEPAPVEPAAEPEAAPAEPAV